MALLLAMLPAAAGAAEPRIFLMGVWPNRMRLFDEQTDEFTSEFELRHGAVTSYGTPAHTPDFRRVFYVTDRMESVEVVDVAKQEVVDAIKLSTPERRVRIFSVRSDAAGKILYLQASAVWLSTDRFTPEDVDFIVYDLEKHQVKATFKLPEGVEPGLLNPFHVSSDGESLFIIGSEIWELSTQTFELVDTIAWSKRHAPGYGGVDGASLSQTEPGVFHGVFTTTDPLLRKRMSGIVRLDLNARTIETFELGPALKLELLALAPDGKTAFAGLSDLAVIDVPARRIVAKKTGFETGRTNNAMMVSADGTKLYVTGVGNAIDIYDTKTLEKVRSVFTGADIMSPALPIPRSAVLGR